MPMRESTDHHRLPLIRFFTCSAQPKWCFLTSHFVPWHPCRPGYQSLPSPRCSQCFPGFLLRQWPRCIRCYQCCPVVPWVRCMRPTLTMREAKVKSLNISWGYLFSWPAATNAVNSVTPIEPSLWRKPCGLLARITVGQSDASTVCVKQSAKLR